METIYYVIKQSTCPTCNGDRFIYNPRWDEFYNEWASLHDTTPWQHDIDNWFRETWHEDTPDEEIPCPDCNGNGTIRQEIPITEVLDSVFDRINKLEALLEVSHA